MSITVRAESAPARAGLLGIGVPPLPSEVIWTPSGSSLTCTWQGESISVPFSLCDGEPNALGDLAHSPHHPLYESLHAAALDNFDELLAAVKSESAEAGWP